MSGRPLKRKYARVERERRFLLSSLPAGIDEGDFMRFRDRYLVGAPIRLRRVEQPDGTHMVTKFGQKMPDPDRPENPYHRLMTTIYMTETEGELFATLPARVSVKRRYSLEEQGYTFVIDVYEAPMVHAGLILAEVECETDEALAGIVCPSWALRDVTHESEWSGALLAAPEGVGL